MAAALSFFIEALKVLPGAILFPFSIYFIWKKMGNSVAVSFSYGSEGFSATRITSIIFTNKKDKPLPIFSAFLLINKDLLIPIEKFDPPIVLRSLEVMQVGTGQFSTYHLGEEQFKLTSELIRDAEFYAITTSGPIRCDIIGNHSDISYAYKNDVGLVTKSTSKFNGHVYNEHVVFAISYLIDGKQQTALVAKSGFIGGDWGFRYNMIPQDSLSKEGVWSFLQQCGYDKMFQGISIDDLQQQFGEKP